MAQKRHAHARLLKQHMSSWLGAAAALLLYHMVSRWLWPSAVVHRFTNDAVPLELLSRQPLRLRRGSQVEMEIRRTTLVTTAGPTAAFGVFVAAGSHLELGDLAGCYSVRSCAATRWSPKERGASGIDVYSYDINETHFVDPTSESGRIDDTQPLFRVEMAAVNEPTAGPPNVTPLDYAFGLCRDRLGALGVPYYATRRSRPARSCSFATGPDTSAPRTRAVVPMGAVRRWTRRTMLHPAADHGGRHPALLNRHSPRAEARRGRRARARRAGVDFSPPSGF